MSGSLSASDALSRLTPAQQLRLRAFQSAFVPPEAVAALVDAQLPPQLLEDERDRFLAALAASAKCFAVALCEEAVAVRRALQPPDEAARDAASGAGAALRPGHLQEAYRRLALRGQVLGAARRGHGHAPAHAPHAPHAPHHHGAGAKRAATTDSAAYATSSAPAAAAPAPAPESGRPRKAAKR